MKRVMTLSAINKTVTIGQYVKAIKMVKANLDKEFRYGLTCWWPCTGREIMRQFRAGMMQRISEGIPYIRRGISID